MYKYVQLKVYQSKVYSHRKSQKNIRMQKKYKYKSICSTDDGEGSSLSLGWSKVCSDFLILFTYWFIK